jgi:hypothetical protein
VRAALALAVLATPGVAWAYIDPSAGSILLQLVLGGAAGLFVVVKLYYRKLLGLFGRRPVEQPDREP